MCVACPCGVIVCVCVGKHMHTCASVCVIIQWQEEFSPPPPQHRMWEVKSSTHTGARAACQRGRSTHLHLQQPERRVRFQRNQGGNKRFWVGESLSEPVRVYRPLQLY